MHASTTGGGPALGARAPDEPPSIVITEVIIMTSIGTGFGSLGSIRQFGGSSSMRGGSMPQPSAEMRQKFEAKFESAAKDAGLDVSQLKELRSQIESAVQDAAANSNNGDVKGDIESAINGVLEENGIDPAEFKEKMGAVFEKMSMPKPGSGGFGGGGYSAGASVNGNQNDLLSKLISSLSGDSSGGLFANLPAGSLVDAAA